MPTGRAWLVWIFAAALAICVLVDPQGVAALFALLKGFLK
jgi:hypothetical protein